MTRTMNNALDPAVIRPWLDQALHDGEHAHDSSPLEPDRIARMLLVLPDGELAGTVAALPDSALARLITTLEPCQRNALLRRLARDDGTAPAAPAYERRLARNPPWAIRKIAAMMSPIRKR